MIYDVISWVSLCWHCYVEEELVDGIDGYFFLSEMNILVAWGAHCSFLETIRFFFPLLFDCKVK